ncbi:MAG: DMT family transporter [Leptolyngbyaceae cyanobacterium T60_A2020_046]|nr:DMT family transporter [Leptolyngbyaceae cyanobacterium T60_A2020_046]
MTPLQLIELLVLAALWGGSFLFMRIAAPEFGPIWLIEFRVLLAGLTLLPIVMRQGLLGELKSHLRPLMVVGLLNSAIPFSLLAFTSLSLPVGMTAILNGTVPFFGVAVAFVWLQEKLTLSRVTGLVVGFLGVVTLVGLRETALTAEVWWAIAAGLGAALLYAIAAPYIRLTLCGVPSLVIATGSQLSAALFLLPLLPFTQPAQAPTAIAYGAVVGLAILSTSVAYILYFRLIQAIGSTRALTVAYLIPLFAMAWGALLLQERITLSMVVGCGLILTGTAIANGVVRASLARSRP